MAATTAQIRAALALPLTNHYGALSPAWNVSAYYVSKPEPPQFDLTAGAIIFDTAQARGSDDIRYILRAVVALSLDVVAQQQMDMLIDTTSADAVKTVMEADRTLGGVVAAIRVADVTEVKLYGTAGGSELPGVEFTIQVWP